VVSGPELNTGKGATLMVTVSLYRLQTACKLEVAMYLVVIVGLAKGALQFEQVSVVKGEPPGITDQVN
jgi:hypothetical protein